MASDGARDLRQRGIAAAKAGQRDEARALLQQSIRIEPNNEAAWLWLASVARDAEERRFSLEKLLEINPNNEHALKALGGTPSEPGLRRISDTKRQSSSSQVPVVPPQPQAQSGTTAAPSVPIPAPEKIAEAQKQVDALLRELPETAAAPVKYIRKTRRRAGESDIVVYRAYLGVGIAAVVALFLIGFIVLITTNDDAAEIVFGPSATPSRTPTVTWTPTPGVTPTPSQQPDEPATPTPLIDPNITPASIVSLPRATPFDPPLLDRVLNDAANVLYRGEARAALPTFAAAREQAAESGLFDPIPYYYEALALAENGQGERAIPILEEAEDQVATSSNVRGDQAIIDAAYAQVYFSLGQEAIEAGDPGRAEQNFLLMDERANAAIETSEELAAPYLLIARRYEIGQDYADAINILDQGLRVPELRGNAELLTERAAIYYEMASNGQAEYGQVDYAAYLVLYVDPTNERAHLIRIQSAFDQENAGEAVIRVQDYLLVYPGSRLGYRLLGDAFRLVGDDNLAEEAYNRGLSSPDTTQDTFDLYASRGNLYLDQGRCGLAQSDFTDALGIQENTTVRINRMEAAYCAGANSVAERDAEALIGQAGTDIWRIQVVQARILIDESPQSASAMDRAASLLESARATAPASERSQISEYLAFAYLGSGSYESALNEVDTAINSGDSPSRRLIRGRILEARNQDDAAILEYEWALTLCEIFPYSGRAEIEARLDDLRGGT